MSQKLGKTRQRNPSLPTSITRLKFISKSGENKKSPDFAQQIGRLFEMSQKLGKTRQRNPSLTTSITRLKFISKSRKTKKVQTLHSKVDVV